jgi:chromosome segregation ATPase
MALTHPRLGAIAETLALMKTLSDPAGVKAIRDEIEPLRQAAADAFDRLGEAQKKHDALAKELEARDADLTAQKAEFDRRSATLAKDIGAHAAAVSDLADEKVKIAELRKEVEAHEARLAEKNAVFTARETEIQRAEAAVEKTQAEVDAALMRAKAKEEAAEQFATAETARLKVLSDRIATVARSVAEVG